MVMLTLLIQSALSKRYMIRVEEQSWAEGLIEKSMGQKQNNFVYI